MRWDNEKRQISAGGTSVRAAGGGAGGTRGTEVAGTDTDDDVNPCS